MRVSDRGDSVLLWLSEQDTEDWATRPGSSWPCSVLRGHRVFAAFDKNGLYEVTVDGKWNKELDVRVEEFNALTSYYLKQRLKPDHPVYFITVGQFEEEVDAVRAALARVKDNKHD